MLPLVSHWLYTFLAMRHIARYGQTWPHPQKSEIHILSHCCQRRTKPQPQVTYRKFCEVWAVIFQIYQQTDSHTGKCTDTFITILSTPIGGKLNTVNGGVVGNVDGVSSVQGLYLIVWHYLVCFPEWHGCSKERHVRQKRLLRSSKVWYGHWWSRCDLEWTCQRLLCRPSFSSRGRSLTSCRITTIMSTFSRSASSILCFKFCAQML